MKFSRWLGYERGWDDGETYEAMGERVLAALEELAARHEGERIVAVTHGGPIRAALAQAEGISHSEARCIGSRYSSPNSRTPAARPSRI